MSIAARCECGTEYKVKDELAGRRVKCKTCGGTFVVAAASREVPELPDISAVQEPREQTPSAAEPKPVETSKKGLFGKALLAAAFPHPKLLKEVGKGLMDATKSGEKCSDCGKELGLLAPNQIEHLPAEARGDRSAICKVCLGKVSITCPDCSRVWRVNISAGTTACPDCAPRKAVEAEFQEFQDEFRGYHSWTIPLFHTKLNCSSIGGQYAIFDINGVLRWTNESGQRSFCYLDLYTCGELGIQTGRSLDVVDGESLYLKLDGTVHPLTAVQHNSDSAFTENLWLNTNVVFAARFANWMPSSGSDALNSHKQQVFENLIYWIPAALVLELGEAKQDLKMRLATSGQGDVDITVPHNEFSERVRAFIRKRPVDNLARKEAESTAAQMLDAASEAAAAIAPQAD
ncbi:MAG: hypothetical protein KDA75_21950, partial [Planctomycetaceae bacterium]|nr:hypothetical protein [Planctomycetaceae bacterium]